MEELIRFDVAEYQGILMVESDLLPPSEDMENQAPGWRGGVDVFGEGAEAGPLSPHSLDDQGSFDEVLPVPATVEELQDHDTRRLHDEGDGDPTLETKDAEPGPDVIPQMTSLRGQGQAATERLDALHIS